MGTLKSTDENWVGRGTGGRGERVDRGESEWAGRGSGGVVYCGWALRARCDGGQGGGGGRGGGGVVKETGRLVAHLIHTFFSSLFASCPCLTSCISRRPRVVVSYILPPEHRCSGQARISYILCRISFLLAFAVEACDACPWNPCSSHCSRMARGTSCSLSISLIKLIRWHTHTRTNNTLSLNQHRTHKQRTHTHPQHIRKTLSTHQQHT